MRQHNKIIDIARWGKDHWSTLLYVECCVVDASGRLKPVHLRTDGDEYPTRLTGGERLPSHNDYDCLEDIEAAGLVTTTGTGLHPIYALTDEGWLLAGRVRRWKAEDKGITNFKAAA